MSASCVFEFNSKKDIHRLFSELVTVWQPGKEHARSITLRHSTNPSLQFIAPPIGQDTFELGEEKRFERQPLDWTCYLDYYFYSKKDKMDFRNVVEIIFNFADGDFYYYPDPDISGVTGSPIPIQLNEVLKYEPSMSNSAWYVIKQK
jgi:hypothetical protein